MSPNQRPSQSPAAGAASSEVKTIGRAAVPAATSAACGVVLESPRWTYIDPALLEAHRDPRLDRQRGQPLVAADVERAARRRMPHEIRHAAIVDGRVLVDALALARPVEHDLVVRVALVRAGRNAVDRAGPHADRILRGSLDRERRGVRREAGAVVQGDAVGRGAGDRHVIDLEQGLRRKRGVAALHVERAGEVGVRVARGAPAVDVRVGEVQRPAERADRAVGAPADRARRCGCASGWPSHGRRGSRYSGPSRCGPRPRGPRRKARSSAWRRSSNRRRRCEGCPRRSTSRRR